MSNVENKFWTAFYTKPRNEKKAAERLSANGFHIYCPTRTVLKQWSDRKKKVTEPVFTSYLFAKVDEIERLDVLRDSGIISNVRWLGKPARIRESEINEIRAFLEEFPLAECFSSNVQIGENMLVESGPLSGQKGIVRRVQGNKAVLSIVSLGIIIQAEISLNHLKRVG